MNEFEERGRLNKVIALFVLMHGRIDVATALRMSDDDWKLAGECCGINPPHKETQTLVITALKLAQDVSRRQLAVDVLEKHARVWREYQRGNS